MSAILDRVRRIMGRPVRFELSGVEYCLTLDEAAALKRRLELAIDKAHDEIRREEEGSHG